MRKVRRIYYEGIKVIFRCMVFILVLQIAYFPLCLVSLFYYYIGKKGIEIPESLEIYGPVAVIIFIMFLLYTPFAFYYASQTTNQFKSPLLQDDEKNEI